MVAFIALLILSITSVHKICGFSSHHITRHVFSYSSTERSTATCLAARPKAASTSTKTPSTTERMLNLTANPNIAIIVDAENVRGKTNFELGHADLLDRLMVWASLRDYALGRTIVVIDHGSQSTAHLLRDKHFNCNSICVTFAGPNIKADDVIARDTQWLLDPSSGTNTDHVLVITADQELSYRCRTANPQHSKARKKTKKLRKKALQKQQLELVNDIDNSMKDLASNTTTPRRVNIVTSRRFLDDMEAAMIEWLESEGDEPTLTSADSTNSAAEDIPMKDMSLFGLRTKILSIESYLNNKCSFRKRQLLMAELRTYKQQWEDKLSLIGKSNCEEDGSLAELLALSLPSSVLLDTNGTKSLSSTSWDTLSAEDQKELLIRWGQRRGSAKREETEDRVILAEMIRSQMESMTEDLSEELERIETSGRSLSLVEMYAKYISSATS
jgi:hypothetical protein